MHLPYGRDWGGRKLTEKLSPFQTPAKELLSALQMTNERLNYLFKVTECKPV